MANAPIAAVTRVSVQLLVVSQVAKGSVNDAANDPTET